MPVAFPSSLPPSEGLHHVLTHGSRNRLTVGVRISARPHPTHVLERRVRRGGLYSIGGPFAPDRHWSLRTNQVPAGGARSPRREWTGLFPSSPFCLAPRPCGFSSRTPSTPRPSTR